jgi:peptide/nickel transport system substrate-binding protein
MSRKWFAVVSFVLLASMLMTACQPQIQTVVTVVAGTPLVVEKTVEKVVTATPIPPTAAPPKAAEKPTDTVVLALQQEPDTLHPLVGSMMARTIANSVSNMGCMGQNEKAEWIPVGCEQVPTLENGGAKWVGEGADKHLEVTYKIKKGWRWTDGTPVTSKDVIYSWQLQMDPEFEIAARDAIEKLYDIVAVDDSTFTAKFMSQAQAKEAAAGTLKGNVAFDKFKDDYKAAGYDQQAGAVVDPVYWNIGWAAGQWLPAHILSKTPAKDQAKADWARKPVFDGPYVVKEWKAGQELVWEKSDKPFPLGDAKVKTIIFRFFAETAAVISALQKGEIDAVTGTGGLTVASAPDLDKIEAAGIYKVLYQPGYQWEHIDINTTKFPLDDVKVRQALYYATDKKQLVDKLYFGKQGTTDLPVPPGLSWAYTDTYNKYPFDKAKAQALLKEAGWDCKALPCTKTVKEGGKDVVKNLEITLMTTDRADRQSLAQVIQSQWKALNVGVNIQFLYGRGLFATCTAGGPLNCRTFDAAIYTWITGDDPNFGGLYDCAGIGTKENNWSGQNYPGWCNKAADEAIAKAEKDADISLSREKRKPFYDTFFKEWTKDVPVIPLFSNTRVYVVRTGWKNWKAGPTQYSADGWNAYEWEVSK